MMEYGKKINISGKTDKISVYTELADIVGNDLGLRVQLEENLIGYIPVVEITNPRASSLKIQTRRYGAMAAAQYKKIDLNDIQKVVVKCIFTQADSGKQLPNLNFQKSSGQVISELYANANQSGAFWFGTTLFDKSGVVITDKFKPDENFNIEISVNNYTYFPSGYNNGFAFSIFGQYLNYGNVGTYFSKDEVISISISEFLNLYSSIYMTATGGGSATVRTTIKQIRITSGAFSKVLDLEIVPY